jgi:hypothetical protein
MNKTIWCFNDDEVGLSWWIDVVGRDPREHMKGVWYGGVGWMNVLLLLRKDENDLFFLFVNFIK